jgi:hypothetical protein
MSLDQASKIVQILSSLAGVAAGVWAFLIYRRNSRRERAQWVENLYSRFFEKDEFKKVRDTLNCRADDSKVTAFGCGRSFEMD